MTTATIVEPQTTVTIAEAVSVTVTASGLLASVAIVEAAAASVAIVEPVTTVTVIEGAPAEVEVGEPGLLDFSDATNSQYLGIS